MHSECHAEIPFNCSALIQGDTHRWEKVPISSELGARDARLDHAGEAMIVNVFRWDRRFIGTLPRRSWGKILGPLPIDDVDNADIGREIHN